MSFSSSYLFGRLWGGHHHWGKKHGSGSGSGGHDSGHKDHGWGCKGKGSGSGSGGKDKCELADKFKEKAEKYLAKYEKYLAKAEAYDNKGCWWDKKANYYEKKADKYYEKYEKYMAKYDEYKCEDPNNAPEFISPASDPVTNEAVFVLDEASNEDAIPFLTIVASDPDGDTLVYSDLTGEDANVFDFNTTTGELSIKPGFGPISPGDDFDADGTYELEFTVTDPGGLTDQLLLDIVIHSGG